MTVQMAFNELDGLEQSFSRVQPTTDGRVALAGVNRSGFLLRGGGSAAASIAAPANEGWVHARVKGRIGTSGNLLIGSGDYIISIRDENGVAIAGLVQNTRNSSSYITYMVVFPEFTSAQNVALGVSLGNLATAYDLDIHYKIAEVDGFIRFYINQVLQREFVGDTMPGTSDKVGSLRFRSNGSSFADGGTSDDETTAFSNILASTAPTLGARVYTLALSAGSVNDWTGDVSNITDTSDTPLTAIYSATNGAEVLMAAGNLASLREGYEVTAVGLGTISQAVTGSPVSNLAGRVKVGATTYDMGAVAPLSAGFSPVSYTLPQDPATGLPWQLADINAVEIGLQART